MDLLFIIFIVVVVLGFAILLCICCYCSCCYPLSYSSSSSHYSERGHGGYKTTTSSKSSKTIEYDEHHWNSTATLPLMTPLAPSEHYSTSSISAYSKQPQPVGFERIAKSQTESNQTINSSGVYPYEGNSIGRPAYPSNAVINETSQHAVVKSHPSQVSPIHTSNNQSYTTISTSYSTPTSLHSPYPNSTVKNTTTYYTQTSSSPPPYPSNAVIPHPASSQGVTHITTPTNLNTTTPNSYNSNKITYITTTSHSPNYATEEVDFQRIDNKPYIKLPNPMQTQSSTKTTTYKTTTLPPNFHTSSTSNEFYSNKQSPVVYSETINESHKSERMIKKHPSTGSLYDNM